MTWLDGYRIDLRLSISYVDLYSDVNGYPDMRLKP